ncbi:MAG: DJ-1/PfpI family protein, partial [Candidatus Hodarchaeales archaeon]
MNRKGKIVLIGILALQVVIVGAQILWFANLKLSRENLPINMRDSEICVILLDGYSESDFQGVKQYTYPWLGVMRTAGLSTNITSNNGNSLKPRFLISEISNISAFDAVFIPGGDITSTLPLSPEVLQLVKQAKEYNIVIAGIGEGVLVQAAAGNLNNTKYTCDPENIDNLTNSGGIYVEEKNVVVDSNIITARSSNFEELSYAIANTLGFSFRIKIYISFEKLGSGWNYSIDLISTDPYIIDSLEINLSSVDDSNEKTLVKTLELFRNDKNRFIANLGILQNNIYVVDVKTVSIYGIIEIRYNVAEISV